MRAITSTTLGMVLLAASTLAADQTPIYPAIDAAIHSSPPAAAEGVAVASYPTTTYALPTYPTYSQPTYTAPTYPAPTYTAPTYSQPTYTALAPPPPAAQVVSMDEVRSEIKTLAWTKGEMKIVPYGSLWGSAIYHTERTNPGAYTLYVFSRDVEGEEAFTLDTRRTRLGVDVTGPTIPALCGAQIGGKVEIDFHGSFVEENKPGVLLRHAYGEVKDDQFKILAGQTWDVISPLYPGTLSYTVLWDQGNIGYRRTQIRLERYIVICPDRLLTLQASVNQDIVSDFTTTANVERESAGWPVLEGRVALTDKLVGSLEGPVTLGLSGHIGEQGFDFTADGPAPLLAEDDVRIQTWSGNVDLYVPITKCTGVQGEFFYGSNLSTFFGGIGQGVSLYTRRGIRAHGGWVDLWHDWRADWHSHVGLGIDDPYDPDVVSGRSYNQVIFANVIHDITDFLVVAIELSLDETKYCERRVGVDALRPGESVGIEFTGQYKF